MCAAALLAAVLAVPAGPSAAAADEGSGGDRGPEPIDFAVVVDQSDSLTEEDLAQEVAAAALLVQGEISGRSRATVIGFGSAEQDGQSAVHEVCEPTVADAAGRHKLSSCVRRLARPDRKRIGPGTDFPAAIRQAVDRITEDGSARVPKVVFLLTDGRLDVRDSVEYGGADEQGRQARGEEALRTELARAREESVQIWPLGFGTGIDRSTLRAMARGGYRNGCAERPQATPRMRVVQDSTDLAGTLQDIFAGARCAGSVEGDRGKPPAELKVEIPPIATDGSITVTKHDPEVTAVYVDPEGREVPLNGEAHGSRYELSGQDGMVEALRVTNPLPGTWRVKLDAPEGHRGREAVVRAIWQGRLRSDVVLNPTSPRPGESATVEVRLQTRDGAQITGSHYLDGLTVSARLTGSGFEPVDVALRDDGAGPDRRAGDVRFTGRVRVPESATGELVLTSEMAAPGVTGDQRPYRTRTASEAAALEAGLTLEDHTVHPGGSIRGTLVVTNNDGRPHTLRLGLEDQQGDAVVRISPDTVQAPPGASEPVPFTVSFGTGMPPGPVAGSITVQDTGDGDRRVAEAFLDVTVEPAPTLWETWWWAILPAAVLLAAALAVGVIRVRARGGRKDTSGLVLELRREGQLLDELKVRRGQGRGYRFTVENPGGARPGLRRITTGGTSSFGLRREASGALKISPPRGRERSVLPRQSLPIGDDLDLVIRDGRHRPGSARPSGEPSRPARPRRPGGRRQPAARTGPDRSPDSRNEPPAPAGDARRYDRNF